MFAKLFEDENLGQILVMLDQGDDTDAAVKFYIEPPNLGVCNYSFGFNDWDKAQELFDSIDQKKAVASVKLIMPEFAKFAPKNEE